MYFLLVMYILGIIFESLVQTNALPRSKRMIDGDVSTIEDFPYLVALQSNFNSCGGALISPRHVLTAAHCVSKDDGRYAACVGAQIWCKKGSKVNVTWYLRHPDYHKTADGNGENDIAVLLLDRPVEFNSTQTAIPMFELGEESKPGTVAVAAGWGVWDKYPQGSYSDLIRSAKLKIIDRQKCIEAYEKIDGVQDGEICTVALADKPRQSPCNGDSGGPLVVHGKVAGVMAHVEDCNSKVYPSVYTEVAYFRDWIDQAVEELSLLEQQTNPNVVGI